MTYKRSSHLCIDTAEQVSQFLDEHGISVFNYDFDHSDKAIQSFQSGEVPVLITHTASSARKLLVLFGSATNVLVVGVSLFTTDQYLSYKELLATSEGYLTFYVDNDDWLSVCNKQLLEQGISLTTDPYPVSLKSPSSPESHPSSSAVRSSKSSKYVADDSICLPKLDSLALAQLNMDDLKYELARLTQQIQKLSCKLHIPLSHIECGDMPAKLVHTDSNHPSMKPQFLGDSSSVQATVHSTAGGGVLHGSKNTSILHVPEISVCDEDETFIPSPTALPDQRGITSSLATEVAQYQFHGSLAPAYRVGYKTFPPA